MTSTFDQALQGWAALFMRLSMAHFNHYTRAQGLSLAQMSVLHYIYYHGPCDVMFFCSLMQLSPAGASQMVDRLARQGLVERLEEAGDRRVRKVHLTARGKQIVEESVQARQCWMAGLAQQLSEEQRQQAAETLRVLHAAAARLEMAENEVR
ncbi:MAG: MarR family winged helix-turn-helix transcriptional regulator [Chloroflexota bacterium]